nr:hypothetical protein Iba_chr11bCG3100 [Ipomoea batatas]
MITEDQVFKERLSAFLTVLTVMSTQAQLVDGANGKIQAALMLASNIINAEQVESEKPMIPDDWDWEIIQGPEEEEDIAVGPSSWRSWIGRR